MMRPSSAAKRRNRHAAISRSAIRGASALRKTGSWTIHFGYSDLRGDRGTRPDTEDGDPHAAVIAELIDREDTATIGPFKRADRDTLEDMRQADRDSWNVSSSGSVTATAN
jgi:hypothetical protein